MISIRKARFNRAFFISRNKDLFFGIWFVAFPEVKFDL
ncbi:hypothetical protein BD94_2429 [Elizabethkingia anophelis NUHP1]|uniref:Uncharacterized protein n=1 Tax=Elizabethkingia anophelis NUHP1 TaxID=1338011 RepID=A0A077EJ13_9FLAO|nr:hypothetical protein BD94_2429 [Elizabethkingia anophelis NUHP1]